MNTDLSFITNENDKNLKARFKALIESTDFFDCLVGYFYSSGFHAIYSALETTQKIRILIGISTNKTTFDMMEKGQKNVQQSFDFSHAETKEEFDNLVQLEMEESEDNSEIEKGV